MRRHPPHLIELSRRERLELETLVRNGYLEQRVARRARVLLAMAQPETLVQELAERVEMSPHGIWYLCRRFDERGLEAVWDAPRSGRPGQFSPLATGPNRTVGLLRTDGAGPAPDPLVHPQLG